MTTLVTDLLELNNQMELPSITRLLILDDDGYHDAINATVYRELGQICVEIGAKERDVSEPDEPAPQPLSEGDLRDTLRRKPMAYNSPLTVDVDGIARLVTGIDISEGGALTFTVGDERD